MYESCSVEKGKILLWTLTALNKFNRSMSRRFSYEPISALQMRQRKRDFISSLPNEVLSQILRLLPAVDLIQLKGVCKLWHKLITCKHFIREHLEFWRSTTSFLSRSVHRRSSGEKESLLLSLSIFNGSELEASCCCNEQCFPTIRCTPTVQLYPLVSCDGLLLALIKPIRYNRYSLAQLIVCNPLMKSCRGLPFLRELYQYILDSCTWTLVRDASVGRYKVFGMTGMRRFSRCVVFELRGGKAARMDGWRMLRIALPWGDWKGLKSTSKNGKVYFLLDSSTREIIVSVNMSTEEWEVSSIFFAPRCMPPSMLIDAADGLSESDGAFYFVQPLNQWSFELWILNDFDNPRWTMHLQVDEGGRSPLDWMSRSLVKPVVVGRDGSRLIIQYRCEQPIYVYDMDSKEWTTLHLDRTHFRGPGEMAQIGSLEKHLLLPHVQSLVSWK